MPVAEPVGAVPPLPVSPGMPGPSPEDNQPTVVRIFALRYATAEDVAKTISRAAPGRPPIVAVPDPRTNAVIITTTAERFKVVEDLIKQLDVDAPNAVMERICRVIVLKNARAEDLAKTLQPMIPSPEAVFSPDPVSNRLIYSAATSATDAIVQKLVEGLDQAKSAIATQQGRKVRVVWLVSGLELPPPPPDMNDVVKELEGMGIEGLGLAAQSMVQTISSGKFTVQCSPAAFSRCRLEMKGTLEEDKDSAPRVELTLSAMGLLQAPAPAAPQPSPGPGIPPLPPGLPSPGPNQLASISTTLMAPPGHKVVLGVSPIEKYTSVFVIQVLPGTSGK